MKNIKSIFAVALGAVALSGCNDLDQAPMSNMITEDQKKEIIENNPEMASASVNSLPTMASSRFALFGSSRNVHTDFGVPSIFLILDHRGQDMASALLGYQWYTAALEMSDFGGTYYDNLIFWRTWYNMINNCNSICALIDPAVENGQMQYFRAQALAFRGWCYFNLAQMYQFTYAKNPDAPTVPVLTEQNLDQAAADGMARASGREIYAQVLSDYNEALTLLDKAQAAGYTRESQASGNLTKTFVDQAVVKGLQARAYLFMQDYDNAATAAQAAIDMAAAKGLEPYSMEDVSKPGFKDINDKAWMWGFYTDPQGSVAGLVGWAGQMTPWFPDQTYPSAGVYRCINKKLYESIPQNDVRKNWWFNDLEMPNTLPSAYQEYLKNPSANGLSDFSPYMTVKFGAHNDSPGSGDNVNDQDVPFMRVEEMYLILAEAQGMKSPAVGAQTLTTFVSAYRQPNYVCNAASVDIFRDEIWKQRRIELWGEGFSYYDIMRFQKGIDRRGGGFDPTLVYVVAPDDPVLLFEIILDEAQNNPLIGVVSNGAVKPNAVVDTE